MDINTTDKVQTGNSTTGTSTSTTYTYSNSSYSAEKGWECPRCGRINAPWVRQCDCSRSNWSITWKDSGTSGDDWWKKYATCDNNLNSTIYQVGGNDYKEGNTYVNVNGTQSNKIDPNVTARNCTNPDNCHTPHYTTETVSK